MNQDVEWFAADQCWGAHGVEPISHPRQIWPQECRRSNGATFAKIKEETRPYGRFDERLLLSGCEHTPRGPGEAARVDGCCPSIPRWAIGSNGPRVDR